LRGRKIEEIKGSSRGIYIRNTADITPKWKNMCSIADTPELGEIAPPGLVAPPSMAAWYFNLIKN